MGEHLCRGAVTLLGIAVFAGLSLPLSAQQQSTVRQTAGTSGSYNFPPRKTFWAAPPATAARNQRRTITPGIRGWGSLGAVGVSNSPIADVPVVSQPRALALPPQPSSQWSSPEPNFVGEHYDSEPTWGRGPNNTDTNGYTYADEQCHECFTWQLLPHGLLYKTYVAGEKEPRIYSVWLNEKGRGTIWETALGARLGLFRYGTPGTVKPNGWQLDVEGAAFPRLDPQMNTDLEATDFRVGIPLTWRRGPTAVKVGYYHISSHLGDEFLLRNPGFMRRNYVRDSFIAGISRDFWEDYRLYGEFAVAPGAEGGAEPWEIQFGGEYNPVAATGSRPCPYAAINFHFRQEFGSEGSVNVLAGLQWRSAESDRLLRVGGQYYNGKSLQYSFFDKHEELLGAGIWIDY